MNCGLATGIRLQRGIDVVTAVPTIIFYRQQSKVNNRTGAWSMHDKNYLLDVPIELVPYKEFLILGAPILVLVQPLARGIVPIG